MTSEAPRPRSTTRESRARLLIAAVLIVVVIAGAVVLLSQRWDGSHASPLAKAILNIVIIGGPIPIVLNVLAAVGIIFVLFRRPTRRRVTTALIVAFGSASIALVVFWVSTATNAFGLTLSNVIGAWTVVAFTSIGLAIASFPGASARRKAGNAAVIVIVILAAIVGINGNFGLDPTIAALAGTSTQPSIRLPALKGDDASATSPLWSRWTPPPDLPKAGRTVQVRIPALISGFTARPAGLYLPPAALVKNPPALPLVIMMMGQPGNPDPSFQAQVLDALAEKHHGLAPIVIVADQIGDPSVDTLCLNTKAFGNAEDYIAQDVVRWARTHLHIDQDPAHWVIAGYSNGGECASALGAKYPSIWENVIDISGEQYEGWQMRSHIAATIFDGNWSKYSATWPTTLLSRHRYPNTVGIFVVASNDPVFKPQTVAVHNAARAANWKTTLRIIDNAGHGVGILVGGLRSAYVDLYPRLGLATPQP